MGYRFTLILTLCAGPVFADCADKVVELRAPDGRTARFTVEVADTNAERALGLMNRPKMATSKGMLFVYDRPQSVAFWMENTLIPLDMLFLDETGTVKVLHSNAKPLDRTPIPGGDDIQYVLEINGGLAEKLGLDEGTQMRNPAIAEDVAAWTCAE